MTISRRDFLRRSALLAAGVVAADQMELLDRLGWTRTLFPGFTPAPLQRWGGTVAYRDAISQYGNGSPIAIIRNGLLVEHWVGTAPNPLTIVYK